MGLLRLAIIRVALAAVLSTALMQGDAIAHEVQPSVADVQLDADRAVIRLTTAVEPLIAGIDLGAVDDTDDAPESDRHDALRALPPEALADALRAAWPAISEGIVLRSGTASVRPDLEAIEIPAVGDVEIRRDSVLTLGAPLPPGADPVVVEWDGTLGPLILRQGEAGTGYETFLTAGGATDPLPRDGVAAQSGLALFWEYVVQGVLHIVPLGLDHILFVLGLFFYSLALRALIWQVSAFTLAHTVTLALAVLGLVSVPAAVVEPLIALSITVVAIENVWRGGGREVGWGRIAVIFAFGLLHGLGFASVFSELDIGGALILKLVAFNIGVEIGQLGVIAAAFLVVGWWAGGKPWYRRAVAIPASVAIGAVGLWWFLERTVLA